MLTILGCGDCDRSDDAVGITVAHRLQQFLTRYSRSDMQVYDATQIDEELSHIQNSTKLLIIDACITGSQPGSVFRVPGSMLRNITGSTQAIQSSPQFIASSNQFRWEQAVTLGRQLFQDAYTEKIEVYLIEAENTEPGSTLSPSVKCAAATVFETIVASLPVLSYA